MIDRMRRAAIRAALSQDWFVRLVARRRQGGPDAGLDPQIAAALEYERIARLPPIESMDPPAARAHAAAGFAPLEVAPARMAEVVDTEVPGPAGPIPVRIFVPPDAHPSWIVYFHGGGGVIGSIAASEPVARFFADRTRCTVASVEYRLGPEHKHPAAIEDATAAWRALVERVPPAGRAGVAGDSFGGFLAAHVDRHARQTGVRQPDLQALIYPIVDLTLTSPSIDRFASGYLLTRSMMHWFRDHYLHPHDDPRAGSPWSWQDLAGSAPALVVTGGFDPLVEEGDAWAERLRAAGCRVRHRRFDALIHGFLSLAGAVRAAHAATDQICADMLDMLHT